MNKITLGTLDALQQRQHGTVLSIYLPTHRYPTPPHMQEDQIRFKNLIRQARDNWPDNDTNTIEQIYHQLETKIDDLDFWQQTTEGMAIFAQADHIEIFHLPIECEERVYIGDSYDLAPLRIILARDQPYYLLTLAMHNTRLLRGDMYGLESVDIEFPTSPEDALNIDEMFANSRTVRSHEGPSGAHNVISPHGQGDSNEAGHEERLQYFRIIDSMIADAKNIDNFLPVLIAGTDSEAGDYKTISKLPTLLSTYVQGNHTATLLPHLHQLTWPIISNEIIDKQADKTVEQFNELSGTDKSSDELQHIKQAANAGRIATLLIDMVRITSDSVSDAVRSTSVPIITFQKHYDQDRLSQLAQTVAAQGGTIVGLAREAMPQHATVAAIYRY